jgi:hypothetical protein
MNWLKDTIEGLCSHDNDQCTKTRNLAAEQIFNKFFLNFSLRGSRYPGYTASNESYTDERWNGEDQKGSGSGLIKEALRNLSAWAQTMKIPLSCNVE